VLHKGFYLLDARRQVTESNENDNVSRFAEDCRCGFP
jgi:hypothetical protein